uniref:Uncharacterized protein n=1 Tax=Candidatus Kentrum sp. LFY TaxID=2126342 RepID=A0A450UBS4_9GAMM|nr:MAG: hypothetical protein BECKLFY1418B_GA0070995_101636 [Candidatus Kentron sp. LFY]
MTGKTRQRIAMARPSDNQGENNDARTPLGLGLGLRLGPRLGLGLGRDRNGQDGYPPFFFGNGNGRTESSTGISNKR